MATDSRKRASSNSWSDGTPSKNSRNLITKTTIETLPKEILEKILGFSGSFNLTRTSRTLQSKLDGLRDQLTIALLPPSSWEDRHIFDPEDEDARYIHLSGHRAHNKAESVSMQNKVFRSPWFHPRQVRYLLPRLMRIALPRLMTPKDVDRLMRKLRENFNDPLEIQNNTFTFDSFVICQSHVKLYMENPFSFSQMHGLNLTPCHSCVAIAWSMPDSLLLPPFDEEDIQLLWMFRNMMFEPAVMEIRDEDFPCSVNADLLVAAIEYAIMAGNVDATRELIFLHSFTTLDKWEKNCELDPKWFSLLVTTDDPVMFRCLAQLDRRSFPYWDLDFVNWAADSSRPRADTLVIFVGIWAMQQCENLESKRLPSGDWMRIECPQFSETAVNFGHDMHLDYKSWIDLRTMLNTDPL